jgi:hypothetical protein
MPSAISQLVRDLPHQTKLGVDKFGARGVKVSLKVPYVSKKTKFYP